MNEIIFTCILAVRNIKRFFKISVLRSLSALFSMIMTGLFLSIFFGAISYINESLDFNDIDSLNLYIASNPNELPIDESGLEFEKWAVQDRVSYGGEYISYADFLVLSESFDTVYPDIINGISFDSLKPTDCIIGKKIAEKYHIGTGEKINIGSFEYTAAGITYIPRYVSKILLQSSEGVELGYPQMYYYRGNNKAIGSGKSCRADGVISYFKGKLKINDLVISLIPCAIMLLYTILANINIIGFYSYKTETAAKVKYFLGAQKGMIIFQLFLDNFIIWSISAAVSYGVIFPIINILEKYISVNMKLPVSALISMLALAFIISLFFSISENKNKARYPDGIYFFKGNKKVKKQH